MASQVNINNLNVLTFIKDIYSSLKHIDNNFNTMKENINSRLTLLEDNQKTILAKLELFETLLTKINETTKETITLDKTLENQLLNKLSSLNNTGIDSKLELKPNELTFANILENNYSFGDINDTLTTNSAISDSECASYIPSKPYRLSDIEPSPIDISNIDNDLHSFLDNSNNTNNTLTKNVSSRETLDNLLFS
jgi:paraquat-inducible protein B